MELLTKGGIAMLTSLEMPNEGAKEAKVERGRKEQKEMGCLHGRVQGWSRGRYCEWHTAETRTVPIPYFIPSTSHSDPSVAKKLPPLFLSSDLHRKVTFLTLWTIPIKCSLSPLSP